MTAGVHVIITGKVQGVCFRMATKQEAEKHGVTGWVRNIIDGSVEAIFEGEKESIDLMLAWCWEGPPAAMVKKVETVWEEHKNEFQTFQIVF